MRLDADSVEVLDDGPGGTGVPGPRNSGLGLTGLTERLAAIGGRVDAGPAPSGGYRLRAVCVGAVCVGAGRTGVECEPA